MIVQNSDQIMNSIMYLGFGLIKSLRFLKPTAVSAREKIVWKINFVLKQVIVFSIFCHLYGISLQFSNPQPW